MRETSVSLVPTILLDFKKSRIRIHRQTLRLLGSPEYIRILVNPEDEVIALQVCEASDARAHDSRADKQPLELYSGSLLQQLYLCGHWGDGQIYRLNGIIIPRESIALFKMNSMAVIPPDFI